MKRATTLAVVFLTLLLVAIGVVAAIIACHRGGCLAAPFATAQLAIERTGEREVRVVAFFPADPTAGPGAYTDLTFDVAARPLTDGEWGVTRGERVVPKDHPPQPGDVITLARDGTPIRVSGHTCACVLASID